MSAGSVAARLTEDAATRAAIETLLTRHGFSERECTAALLLCEMYLEGFGDAGGELTAEIVLRAGAKAVDTVWSRRCHHAGG